MIITEPMPPYLSAHKADLSLAMELCHRAWNYDRQGNSEQAIIHRDLMDKVYIRLEEGYPQWKVNYERHNLRLLRSRS